MHGSHHWPKFFVKKPFNITQFILTSLIKIHDTNIMEIVQNHASDKNTQKHTIKPYLKIMSIERLGQ